MKQVRTLPQLVLEIIIWNDLGSNCSIDAEVATNIAKVLEVNKTLSIIRFNGRRADNKAIKIICDGLKKNNSLAGIDLERDNRHEMEDEGLGHLTDMLEVNTTLTFIMLYSYNIRRWHEPKYQPIKNALDRNIAMLKFVAEFVYNAPAYNSKSKIDIANISKFILYQKVNKSSLYSAIDKLVNKDEFVRDSNYNRPIDDSILKKMEGIEEYIKNYYYSFGGIFYLKGVCKDINGQSESLLSILPEEVQAMLVELMGPKENIWQVGLKRIKEKIESKQHDIEKTEAEAGSNKLTEQKIANASDILSADNKNNSGDNFSIIANNSNHPYDSPQTQNEVNEVKNHEDNQVNENESILDNLRDFVRRGKFEEIKPIVDRLPIEQFKEIVKAHTNSDWNLFHYVARRGELKILNSLYSKLKDNSEQDLIFNLLKEKDEFNKTPYNVAQNNNNNELCEKLLQLLNEMEADSAVKEEIMNEAVMKQPTRYKPSERLVEGLEKTIREEMKNNKNDLPYFEDVRKAIELDCNNLAVEMIKELKDGIKVKLKAKEAQKEKELFFASHEDYGWNLLHFVATKGDTNILKTLCEFDLELTKKMSREQNEDHKYPYNIAQEKHYNEFCNEVKGLMGEEFNNNLTV